MRKFIIQLFLICMVQFGFAQGKSNKIETVTITTSAVCEMCIETISNALKFEKGVSEFTFNEANVKELTVTYNSKKTSVDKIIARINKTGYDANESPADEKAYSKLHSCCKKDSH